MGSLDLYGNQLRSTDTNPYNVWARRISEPYNANHYSQMKLTSTPSREVGGPAVRVQLNGSEINGYILDVVNSTTAAIWVRYGTSGTWQQVGANFTGTFASGDVYKLAISGNVLTVYRNGVSLGTRTDANNRIPSGGAPGMSISYPGTWDDWQGGNGDTAPNVIGLSPSYATAGGAAFTLTVSGSSFVSGAKVRWNGADRTTTFVSSTQLQASILAADIAAAGTIPVTVRQPRREPFQHDEPEYQGSRTRSSARHYQPEPLPCHRRGRRLHPDGERQQFPLRRQGTVERYGPGDHLRLGHPAAGRPSWRPTSSRRERSP